MSGPLAGCECGCDGSRPCMEPGNQCKPAKWVPCTACDRRGTELCNYVGYEDVNDGCYFAIGGDGE